MDHIKKSFEKLGLEVDLNADENYTRIITRLPYRIEVARDKKSNQERFKIDLDYGVEALVIDIEPDHGSLLLMLRETDDDGSRENLAKMLLGRDERQLFVAAAPIHSKSVIEAMDGLKPDEVIQEEKRRGVKSKKLMKRRNKARLRQGDFFFVPRPQKEVPEELILYNEPINRGRGASHMVEELFREGGEQVWVCYKRPNGVTEKEYMRILKEEDGAKNWGWRIRMRNPRVYARGAITHGEHKTLKLRVWHRVLPNSESRFNGFSDMAFLD